MKVFVAGATGAVGAPLVRRLLQAGHEVTAMGRSRDRLGRLADQGAEAVCVDAMDRSAVLSAVRDAKPEIVIDQLTSLPSDPARIGEAGGVDRALRLEGGANLFVAAEEAGASRFLQQSSGFFLDGSGDLATEASPMRGDAPGSVGENARMYAELEARVASSSRMEGVSLRLGFLYGPGTWYWPDGGAADAARRRALPIAGAGTAVWSFVHVDDAADAMVQAISAPVGTYNIVDDDPVEVNAWLPAFCAWVEAPPPQRLPRQEAATRVGDGGLYYHEALSGASNRKARELLDFSPRPLTWLAKASTG